MLKNSFIIAFLFFGNLVCLAQKIIQKEFSSEEIHTLSIVDNVIYKITIYSSEEKNLKVLAHVSGEHSESIIIEEKISEETLELKTGLIPFIILENDKLAAHKVMAVEMEIVIPKTMSIEIKSVLASLETTGAIKNLAVSLENGSCVLNDFSGNAHLKTTTGNITVFAKSNVSGKAISTHGIVQNELSLNGKFFVEAESINGTIKLLQTK